MVCCNFGNENSDAGHIVHAAHIWLACYRLPTVGLDPLVCDFVAEQ